MWAKAPLADVTAETRADRQDFLSTGLRPVECATCETCVLVKKNSRHHMSIQWQSSTDTCPEFAAHEGPSALMDTCPQLRATINGLVTEGLLEVPDDHTP